MGLIIVENKPILNYMCLWDKNKDKTWSGTTLSLFDACSQYFNIADKGFKLSKIENKLIRFVGKKCQSYQFSSISLLFIKLRSLIKIKNNKCTQLQIGDLFRSKAPYYIYQDLTVQSLLKIKNDDLISFSYSGFSKISSQAFNKRLMHEFVILENVRGIFTMGKWLSEFIKHNTSLDPNKVHHVGAGININPSLIDYS